MELSAIEQQFLLELLEHFPGHRAQLEQMRSWVDNAAGKCDRLCQRLYQQGWLDYTYDITRYKLAPAGKMLLHLDCSILPVTPDERLLLKAAATRTATPDCAKRVSPLDRQRLLHQLLDQKLIRICQRRINEVWLTPQGKNYLQNHGQPAALASGLDAGLSPSSFGSDLSKQRNKVDGRCLNL
jgi:hypothetical protein